MTPVISQDLLKEAKTTVTETKKAGRIYIHFNRFHNGDARKIWHLRIGNCSAFVGEWKKAPNVRVWSEFAGINAPQPSAFVVAHGKLSVIDNVAYITA